MRLLKEIKRETYRFPASGATEASKGVFSYLARACVTYPDEGAAAKSPQSYEIAIPTPPELWKHAPLQLPLDPTPWQLARALHREHPELPWPERMAFRPQSDW